MVTKPESLISAFLPVYAVRQVNRVAVQTKPQRTYEAARAVDIYRVPFVRRLFNLRLIPERVAAKLRGGTFEHPRSSRIDDIVHGEGFQLLAEAPGTEVVVGSIGKFWRPNIEWQRVPPGEFATFAAEGYGKLAWSIRVDPRQAGGSWLTVELRVSATDDASLRKFKRYWHLIGPFSHAIRRGVLRLLENDLGRVEGDDARSLPGDELVPAAKLQKTHAAMIEAPVERVWPWLVQMGGGRAGWYSIDLFDNGNHRSATRIVPELQHLAVGDVLPAKPGTEDGFTVLTLAENQALVIGDPSLLPGRERPATAPPWKTSWSFSLEPVGPSATRLVVRVRADYPRTAGMATTSVLLALAHEVMERAQLRNLRRRAELVAG